MAQVLTGIALIWAFSALSGCGILNNLESMRASMDRMSYNTGVMASNMPYMANSTQRMANVAERMDRKSNEALADLNRGRVSVERTVESISQTSFDYNKKTLATLDAIKVEIGKLSESLKKNGHSSSGMDPASANALRAKLQELEARLSAVTSILDKSGKTP